MALICVISRFILLSTIIVIFGKLNPIKGIVQQETGPKNITRVEGETYVYILCPFDGSYSFKWKINNVDYEVTSLPEGMIPATYGILIIEVQQSMNNTTFQCWVPTGAASGIRESSIGTLTVIESGDNIPDPQLESSINVVPQINLDHQRIFFFEDRRTIAWNLDSFDTCNMFQINASVCNDTVLRSWQTHETEITISSMDLKFEQDIIDQTFYKVDAFNDQQQICRELPERLSVNINDITEEKAVPLNGDCFDISSLTVPSVVLPKNRDHSSDLQGQDCICSILINAPCYDFSTCSCINETIFSKSIFSCKLQTQQSLGYHLCFLNLTTDMNNTVIHIFESYRYCISSRNGQTLIGFYREYLKSFRIITALPNPPIINIDYEMSEINFSSENNDEIQVDYYRIIISDVTRNIFYYDDHTDNHTSISGIFQGSACLPYNVTVQAHNSFGFSENEIIVPLPNEPNDECLCINQNVIITMALVEETDGILFQVNCSQTRYLDSEITLKVSAEQDAGTVTNVTTTCRNQEIPFGLQCGVLYTIVIYWIKDNLEEIQNECIVEQIAQKLQCTGPDGYNSIIAALFSTVAFAVFLAICIAILIPCTCVSIVRCRESRYRSFPINNSNINNIAD